MKVLVSTRRGQGQRESDFFEGLEGELVFFSLELTCPIDRDCGCRRSLTGMTGSSTTFEVAEKPISREEYVAELKASMIYSGRFKAEDLDEKSLRQGLKGASMGDENIDSFIADYFPNAGEEAGELLSYAAEFPVGTVLEKRGEELYPRLVNLTPEEEVQALLQSGESKTVEFKESLSLDVRKQTKEGYIERESLKTIAAFLNSPDGGTLLVGVSDDGRLVGIGPEIEKFHKSKDKFLLHFKNLVKAKIGEEYYPFLNWNLMSIHGRPILEVNCKKSTRPCFIDETEFFVRTNPAIDKLQGTKMIAYIQHNFRDIR